ncbi:DUF6169 family protein [Fibrella sp. WM1]|uniref:DUF6169 family protein n=1 Tax=Fibrella musci TaxID=3242485 RepID=UPI003522EEE2
MASRTPNPYPCTKEEEAGRISYAFVTDQHVHYRAYFSDYSYMFGSHTFLCQFYSFDLVVVGELRPPKFTQVDQRIADTVVNCFSAIFQAIDNVVITVYDSSDQAELARKRKFTKWFNDADVADIEKVDFEVADESYTLLSSVFLHTSLPDKDAILDRYQLILEGGNIPLD